MVRIRYRPPYHKAGEHRAGVLPPLLLKATLYAQGQGTVLSLPVIWGEMQWQRSL